MLPVMRSTAHHIKLCKCTMPKQQMYWHLCIVHISNFAILIIRDQAQRCDDSKNALYQAVPAVDN